MSATRKQGFAAGDERHEIHSIDNPAVEAGMSRDVINVGLNVFRASIARYPDEVKDALEWLWGYTFDVLGNSKIELEKAIGYDWSFIYSVFTGTYDGEFGALMEAIASAKKRAETKMPLVDTIVTRRIFDTLDYAAKFSAMVTITGPTGRGKTYAAQYWARLHNHGRTRYIRVPSGCTRRQLSTELAARCGIGHAGVKKDILEQRLFKAFTSRNVIIADEAGFLLPRGGRADAIELLRDLHDKCGCAIALIFTDVYIKEFSTGTMSDYFEQFRGRIKYALDIPDKIFRSEIEAACRSFTPAPSAALIECAYASAKERDGKLRTLYEDLRRAAEYAASENRPMVAGDLKLCVQWRKSGGVWPEE